MPLGVGYWCCMVLSVCCQAPIDAAYVGGGIGCAYFDVTYISGDLIKGDSHGQNDFFCINTLSKLSR